MIQRRAKIVATLGPSSNTTEQITKLIESGLNVARVNMSHGTYEQHSELIKSIREAASIAGREVAILMDLQGPKIRVDKLDQNLILKEDEEWFIGPSSKVSKYPQHADRMIPTVYEDLVKDARVGCRILFDDGNLAAIAMEKTDDLVKIKVTVGGELKSNKGINLPDVHVSAPSLTVKDESDLMFGLTQGIDYLALSFVRAAQDILKVKYLMHKMKVNIPIVSKIEKPEAVTNIDSIIKVSDVIMIARGDMGVEVGNHLVPSIQKDIIERCNLKGVPVITATQMLESMITNPIPTRAEASDVANAIWDGTDAVMLSGETASGKYPLETIKMMGQIIGEAEKKPKERPLLRNVTLKSITAMNMVAASLIAEKSNAKFILSVTEGGNSCLKISRFRPSTPVLGLTSSLQVARKMTMYWGVAPFKLDVDKQDHDEPTFLTHQKLTEIKKALGLENGDKIVITHGDGKYFQHGLSNSIRVETIRESLDKAQREQDILKVDFDKGSILLDTNVCAGCQNCVSICPHEIYKVNIDGDSYIDDKRAHECTLDYECVERCPTGAIELIPTSGHDKV
jgi:pyruvate kinase